MMCKRCHARQKETAAQPRLLGLSFRFGGRPHEGPRTPAYLSYSPNPYPYPALRSNRATNHYRAGLVAGVTEAGYNRFFTTRLHNRSYGFQRFGGAGFGYPGGYGRGGYPGNFGRTLYGPGGYPGFANRGFGNRGFGFSRDVYYGPFEYQQRGGFAGNSLTGLNGFSVPGYTPSYPAPVGVLGGTHSPVTAPPGDGGGYYGGGARRYEDAFVYAGGPGGGVVYDVPLMPPLTENGLRAYRDARAIAARGGTVYVGGAGFGPDAYRVLPDGALVNSNFVSRRGNPVLRGVETPSVSFREFYDSNDPLIQHLARLGDELAARRATDRSIMYQLRGGVANMRRGQQRRDFLRANNARIEAAIAESTGPRPATHTLNLLNPVSHGTVLINYRRNGVARQIHFCPNHLDLYEDYYGNAQQCFAEDGILVRPIYGEVSGSGRPYVRRIEFVFTQPGTYGVTESLERGAANSISTTIGDGSGVTLAPAGSLGIGGSPSITPRPEGVDRPSDLTTLHMVLLPRFDKLAAAANTDLAEADVDGVAVATLTGALVSIDAALKVAREVRGSPAYTMLPPARMKPFDAAFRTLRQGRLRLMRRQLDVDNKMREEDQASIKKMEAALALLPLGDASIPAMEASLTKMRVALASRTKAIAALEKAIADLEAAIGS